MIDIMYRIFPYAIAYTIPLLVTSLGGLFSERSGVVNIGLEGLMVVGSFAGAITIIGLEDIIPNGAIWVGLLSAAIFAGIFSLLHAFASIHLKANQIISGTAINMIAGAITLFIARNVTGSGNLRIRFGLSRVSVPLLKDIPFIGKLLFTNTYLTTWVALCILLLARFVIYQTSFGLRLRSCGEHPQAAAAAGINVYFVRYIAVFISGCLAGLGGAVILVTVSGEFSGKVDGLGFLALAALIFGQWKPFGILGATFFFGLASTIANSTQTIAEFEVVPEIILKTFPYVVTLIALIIFSKKSQAPKAIGEPFDQGKR